MGGGEREDANTTWGVGSTTSITVTVLGGRGETEPSKEVQKEDHYI